MVGGKRVSVVDDDPGIAQAKAVALKNGLIEEKKKGPSFTVGQAIDRYIESKDAVLSPSTIRGYKSMRRNSFGTLEKIPLSELTPEDVQRHVNDLAKESTPKYVRNVHGLLSATIEAYRPDFTLRTTLPQKQKKEIQIPTIEEVVKIEDTIKGTSFELPFLLAVWMGLRTSEIRGLTWDCIEGEFIHVKQALVSDENNADVLKLTKTYSGDRKIRIPAEIKSILDGMKHDNTYIVPFNRWFLYNRLSTVCKNLGLPHYRFHDLRHVQASIMLALGVPDKYAMERMGHASTNMLKTVYQHTMRDKQEEVADMVDKYFLGKLSANRDE